MSFRILTDPREPLLKRGHYVEFIGNWGVNFKDKFYRVSDLIQFERDYRAGYLAAAATAALSVDPKDSMGLEPRYYDSIFQTRIGMSQGWNMYLQWPANDYRGMLENPSFVVDPVAADDKKFIGVITAAKPSFGTASGKITSLTDATLTTGPAVPYNQVMWLERIEIANHVTTDIRVVAYDTFTDTGGVARTVQIFDYSLVANQTIGVDVERSKKILGTLKFQCTEGTPTGANPVNIYAGGLIEAPKLDRFFEFTFVKDWMPVFKASTNSFLDYEKIVLCCLVNKCKIASVKDDAIRRRLSLGEIPSYPMYHYSQYESRAM